MSKPNTIDAQGRSVVQPNKPTRATRESGVGNSYAEWTSGKNSSDKSGGGFVFIVFLTIIVIIVRKLL